MAQVGMDYPLDTDPRDMVPVANADALGGAIRVTFIHNELSNADAVMYLKKAKQALIAYYAR